MMSRSDNQTIVQFWGEVSVVSKTVPDIVSKKEANLLERKRHDTGEPRTLIPCTCPDGGGCRF